MENMNSTVSELTSIMTSQISKKPDVEQVTHLIFLILVCLIGTFGNIMTIIAVKIERKLRESLSNLFIVNLAIADLIVCSSVVPMLIGHDALAESLFGPVLCYVTVSISGVACHTAAATMTCIALTRYIAASRSTQYHSIVTRKRVYLAITGVWLFAAINTVPILIAWLETGYDVTKYVCVCFDGTFPLYYTLGPVFIGHFFPHAVTMYCYFCIVRAMRKSRRKFSSANSGTTGDTSVASLPDTKEKRRSTYVTASESEFDSQKTSSRNLSVQNWSKHEMQLLKTSMWVIGFFSFCWIPYGILVLLQDLAPIELKKTFASLCLLSFSLNPVIYGLLSKSFRRAYYRIIRTIFCNLCGFGRDRMVSITSLSATTSNNSTGHQKHEMINKPIHHYQNQTESKTQYGRSAQV